MEQLKRLTSSEINAALRNIDGLLEILECLKDPPASPGLNGALVEIATSKTKDAYQKEILHRGQPPPNGWFQEKFDEMYRKVDPAYAESEGKWWKQFYQRVDRYDELIRPVGKLLLELTRLGKEGARYYGNALPNGRSDGWLRTLWARQEHRRGAVVMVLRDLRAIKEMLEYRLRAAGAEAEAPKQPKEKWRDVRDQLLKFCNAGEPYTTQQALAHRLGCSPSTINKAISGMRALREWKKRHAKRTPKAQSITEVVTDQKRDEREPDPSAVLTDDEVDSTMAKLIAQAETRERRAELNGLDSDRRRKLARTYLEHEEDRRIQDKAKKGNRLLGRKP